MGFLHIPAERVNSDHTAGSDSNLSQFPKDFVHIDGPLAVHRTRNVRLRVPQPRPFKNDETLTWISPCYRQRPPRCHRYPSEHHRYAYCRSIHSECHSRVDSKSWIEPFRGDMQRTGLSLSVVEKHGCGAILSCRTASWLLSSATPPRAQ